jgi:DNA-3-methyladenine glycosylase I
VPFVALDGFPRLSVLPLLDTILCAILCAEGQVQGCFNGPPAATVGDYHIPNEPDSTEGMNSMSGESNRCPWAKADLYVQYHDTEWGVPVHDNRLLFEFLILEGAQAGLSWETILKKRENYREAFDSFDPVIVAKYGKAKLTSLLSNAGIVRNRLKIEAAILNAKMFLAVQEEFGTFDEYIWGFVGHAPKHNARKTMKQIPAKTPESDAMSKDLQRRGFKFVGSTICYAFMQAVGMVNDHLVGCFRHGELQKATSKRRD